MIFAEVLLLEIQQFMGFLYGSLIRFYLPVVPISSLQAMKEDLLELISSSVIVNEFGDLVLNLCRLTESYNYIIE